MEISARRIVLDLDEGTPLRGTINAASGFVRPFTGWISLLAALEAAIAQPGAGTPEP